MGDSWEEWSQRSKMGERVRELEVLMKGAAEAALAAPMLQRDVAEILQILKGDKDNIGLVAKVERLEEHVKFAKWLWWLAMAATAIAGWCLQYLWPLFHSPQSMPPK